MPAENIRKQRFSDIFWAHSKGVSSAAGTSKMKRFVIIVNGIQSLTIITKRSILDVAAALDPPLHRNRPAALRWLIWYAAGPEITDHYLFRYKLYSDLCSCYESTFTLLQGFQNFRFSTKGKIPRHAFKFSNSTKHFKGLSQWTNIVKTNNIAKQILRLQRILYCVFS